MNKISEIHLLNFQRYKKLVIKLSPKFNCIWGSNNEGKSIVTRAIDWMFTNGPRGDWMCRVDEAGVMHTAIVKFVFDDDVILKRVKGKDKNYYAIDEEEFHEFTRTGIPEQVQVLLDINTTLKEEIGLLPQIDSQDDLPFLVSAKTTNTDKARAVNLLTGMNIAENAIKSFNADKMGHSREITFCNKKIEDLKGKVKDLSYVKKLPIKRLDRITEQFKKLSDVFEQLNNLSKEHKTNTVIISDYKILRKAYGKIKDIELINDNLTDNQTLLLDVIAINRRYEETKGAVEPLPDVDFDKIQVQVVKIDKKRSTLLKLQHLHIDYDVLKDRKTDSKKEADKLHKEFAGKACPMCDGKGKL